MAEEATADPSLPDEIPYHIILFAVGVKLNEVSIGDATSHCDCLPPAVIATRLGQVRAYLDTAEEQLGEQTLHPKKSLRRRHVRGPTYSHSVQPSTAIHSSTPTARDRHGTRQLSIRSAEPAVTSDVGLLSLRMSDLNIANLLQQARCKYQANDFERDIVKWYGTVFSSKNITSVKDNILAFHAEAPSTLLTPPGMPQRIDTVAQHIHKIQALQKWPKMDQFRQFHLLLSYARLARHWKTLVDLSKHSISAESKYMREVVELNNITRKRRGEALVSGFMVWTVHHVNQTNKKKFDKLRGNIRYLYNIGRVVLCVRQHWRTVMLLLLPQATIQCFSNSMKSHMDSMRKITAFLSQAEDYKDVERVADLHVLPAILQGTRPAIRLTDPAFTKAITDRADLVWLLSSEEGKHTESPDESSEETHDEFGRESEDALEDQAMT